MESFCSNPKCMFHQVVVEKDVTCTELEIDSETPIILADSVNPEIHRASFMAGGQVKHKFCENCIEAINMVHEVARGNSMPFKTGFLNA